MGVSQGAIDALGRDHDAWLVQARVARTGPPGAAVAFLAGDGLGHVRVVAEQVLPALVAGHPDLVARWALARARLDAAAAAKDARLIARGMVRLIAIEAREVLPAARTTAPPGGLGLAGRPAEAGLVVAPTGGPAWGRATRDLNLTLVAWPPAGGVGRHVNAERDVLVVPVAGSATLTVDGEDHVLRPGMVAVVRRGAARSIVAGSEGVRYLSAHRRDISSADA
jgi:mannose-6-phosphate isomerase-like protein (cupin superfamily)